MAPSRAAPGSIVVGVDGSAGSAEAQDWAADQAAREHRPLILVHSEEPVPSAGTEDCPGSGDDCSSLVSDARRRDAQMMDAATNRVQARHGTLEIIHVLSREDPRTLLLDLSREAASVVLGSRGRGPVASLLLGSVSVEVASRASCPVVVLHPGPRADGGVVVGVPGTEQSVPALELAYRTASLRGCPLTVVHCYHDPTHGRAPRREAALHLGAEEQLVAQAVAGLGERFPDVPVGVRLVPGRGYPELLTLSEGCALLVVGQDRRTGLHGLLHDPVPTSLLEHATCPVAVVPSP